jgi:hypothetical protein
MRFHLPKPLHGWREFAGEVGIIVIGVLIALSAEQVVEALHWRSNVAQAREDLGTELQGDLFNAEERARLETCIDGRLDQIDELIDHPPARPWKLLPGHNLVPIHVWSSSGWDSAVADGAVAHMSRRERARYAFVYSYVRGMHAIVLEEYPVSIELRMMEHGGPLSEASQDRLRADVARVRGYNHLLAAGGGELARDIEQLGVRLMVKDQQALAGEKCAMPHDTLSSGAA